MDRVYYSCGILIILGVLIVACQQPESPENRVQLGHEISDSEIEVDWQEVEAVTPDSSFGVIAKVCRAIDRWHEGSKPEVPISFRGDHVMDGNGNRLEMRPEEWKGMVTQIHRSLIRSDSPGYMAMRAAPASFYEEGNIYEDGFGYFPRYYYHIRLIDLENLEFLTQGLVD